MEKYSTTSTDLEVCLARLHRKTIEKQVECKTRSVNSLFHLTSAVYTVYHGIDRVLFCYPGYSENSEIEREREGRNNWT